MKCRWASLTVVSLLVLATVPRAWAQTPLPPAPPVQPSGPPPDAWNTPHPSPPPDAQSAPPPPYAPPPYAQPIPYGAPTPFGANPHAMYIYENEKKSPGIALLINFLL